MKLTKGKSFNKIPFQFGANEKKMLAFFLRLAFSLDVDNDKIEMFICTTVRLIRQNDDL